MRPAKALSRRRRCIKYAIGIALIVLLAWSCPAQEATMENRRTGAVLQGLDKYPGLLPELGRLFLKLQENVQIPPPRRQSCILPRLPESTARAPFFRTLPAGNRLILPGFRLAACFGYNSGPWFGCFSG